MFTSQGSLAGGGDNSLFSYNATSSSLDFWNIAGSFPLPSSKTQAVPATGSSSSPAWSFTGLSASTSYHFGGYLDLKNNTVQMVMSDVNNGESPGSQQWVIQTIEGDNHFPLFIDWPVPTTASGSTSGGGSPGGGAPTCPAEDQLLETVERGFILASELETGMHVRGWQDEWNRIKSVRIVEGWLHHVTIAGETFHVDLGHRWLPPGVAPNAPLKLWRLSAELRPGDFVQGANGKPHPVEAVSTPHWGRYVEITAERQRFRLGRLVAHNFLTQGG